MYTRIDRVILTTNCSAAAYDLVAGAAAWRRVQAMVKSVSRLGWMVAGALSVAGCGAGIDDPVQSADPQVTVATKLRARALALSTAAGAVAPEEAARQLMDYAESVLKDYFPGHQPTGVLVPFHYRYYPETGAYLGVVVSEAAGYEYLGVYVMGGPFGSAPAYVGPLTSYITPVPPPGGPGPSGFSNGCFETRDHDPMAPGTRTVQVDRTEGPVPSTITSETRTVGPAVFEGQNAVELRWAWADGDHRNGLPGSAWLGMDQRSYARQTGSGEMTYYGSTTAVDRTDPIPTGGIVTSSSRTRIINDPPFVDQQGQLPLGGSVTHRVRARTISSSTTTVTGGPVTIPPVVIGPNETMSEGAPTTVTFLRRERVTVPLGTFDACVYQYEYGSGGGTGQVWIADGRGFNLKTIGTSGGVMTTTVAVAVTINGRAVVP